MDANGSKLDSINWYSAELIKENKPSIEVINNLALVHHELQLIKYFCCKLCGIELIDKINLFKSDKSDKRNQISSQHKRLGGFESKRTG